METKNTSLIVIAAFLTAALCIIGIMFASQPQETAQTLGDAHEVPAVRIFVTGELRGDKPAYIPPAWGRGNSAGCTKYTYGFVTRGYTQHLYHGDNCQVAAENRAETRVKSSSPIVETTPEVKVIVCEDKPVKDDKPTEDKPAVEETPGNPGNLKAVGNAGENPNGRGTMVQDDPAGINGEHGNQGTNPHAGGNRP